MADEKFTKNLILTGARQPLSNLLKTGPELRLRDVIPRTPIPGPSQPAPVPPPQQPLPPVAPAPPSLPAPSGDNPFASLPFRSPGDRIKADDFNALSKGLKVIFDTYVLSASLFGVAFGQAKLALSSEQYQVQRVMTVFGAEIEDISDSSLDNRKVIQVVPAVLGERQVMVVVAEAVETRRFAPNLMGLTYSEASERLQGILGEVTFPSTPVNASQLVGLSLSEAKQILTQ
jgi:hypothetical protein